MKMKAPEEYAPEKCWVGEQQKVCYADEETALLAARAVEYEHGLGREALVVYKCEYGEHWHLANRGDIAEKHKKH